FPLFGSVGLVVLTLLVERTGVNSRLKLSDPASIVGVRLLCLGAEPIELPSEPVELPAAVVDHLCLLVDDSIAPHELDLHLAPRGVLEVAVGECSAEAVELLAGECRGGERVRVTHGLSFRWVWSGAAAEDIHALAHRPGRR